MKATIVAEIERITGGKLTRDMCGEIADRVLKIVDDHNRTAALAAVETVKSTLVQAAEASLAKE